MNLRQRRNHDSASDEQLMDQLSGIGKSAAFETLFKRYHQRMYDYMLFMLYGDGEQARDFVQELFLKVIGKADSFDSTACFRTWLYAMARNMCKNERRNQGNRRRLQELFLPGIEHLVSTDESEKIERKLLWQQIIGAVEYWDEISRTTFLLRYQQNLPLGQIAEIMKCPEGTVKSRLYHISKKLAKEFNPEIIDESESTNDRI